MTATERRAYERRLLQLMAATERLSELLMSAEPEAVVRIVRHLESLDIETELIREALSGFDGVEIRQPVSGND